MFLRQSLAVWLGLLLLGGPAGSTPSSAPPSAALPFPAVGSWSAAPGLDPLADSLGTGASPTVGSFPDRFAEPIPVAGPLVSGWVPPTEGAWQELPTPSRWGACAVYDPDRDRFVLFGGSSDGGREENSVWDSSLIRPETWTRLVPAGERPAPRRHASAIYDALERRMIVFGGYSGGTYLNDVWSLSLSGPPRWSRLAPAGELPPGLVAHSAVFDRERGRMIVFGGGVNRRTLNRENWQLSLDDVPRWSRITTADSTPPPRAGHGAIFDPQRRAMIVFGGDGYAGLLGDLWQLSLDGAPSWTRLFASGEGPPAVSFFPTIYDPVGQRMVVVYRDGRTWGLSMCGEIAWRELGIRSDTRPLSADPAVYDPLRGRLVMYTQNWAQPGIWALPLTDSPAWSELPFPSGSPAARMYHSAIFDPIRQRMGVHPVYWTASTAFSCVQRPGLWLASQTSGA